MSTSLLSGGIALLMAVGLVVTVGGVSLLSGAIYFLFGKPKFEFLKTTHEQNGFAFGFSWNSSREPAKFDNIKIRMYNPFGEPTMVEVSQDFDGSTDDFARDIQFDSNFNNLVNAKGFDNSTITIEVSSTKDNIVHHFEMKGRVMRDKLQAATQTADEYNNVVPKSAKPLYHQVSKEFIADPMAEDHPQKVLKIPTNPQFAPDFLGLGGGGGGDKPAEENFAVKKVWIDPGCIVCDACEGIYPEVFEVTDDTCIIRPGAPLENGLLIQEAAEACPVEVIKFDKA